MIGDRSPVFFGTLGAIRTKQVGPALFESATYYRLSNGIRKQVSARDRSAALAEYKLIEKCSALDSAFANGMELTPSSTLYDLLTVWIEQKESNAPGGDSFRRVSELHIIPKIGSVRLNELSTPRVQQFFSVLSPGVVNIARAALASAVEFAIELEIMTINVVKDTKLVQRRKGDPADLSAKDILTYRARIEQWCRHGDDAPLRGNGLLEIVDVCIGSAARIGEIIALRWADVDLKNGTITLSGTVDSQKKERREWPTLGNSWRAIFVGEIAINALYRQWERSSPEDSLSPVFPARTGKWRRSDSIHSSLRQARGEGLDYVTLGAFRQTAYIRISHQFGLSAACRYLGYSSPSASFDKDPGPQNVIDDYSPAFSVSLNSKFH